jgi:hypothetical protein
VNAERYLAAVSLELRDLPWRLRKSLIADLRLHLAEMPADEDLEARLGIPSDYANELRAAAGITRSRGAVAFLRAGLAILGTLAVGIAWGRSYQPLAKGHWSRQPDHSREGALQESVVRFREGKPFQLGFSLMNTGSFSVKVIGVPIHNGFLWPFAVRTFIARSDGDGIAPMDRFRPFTLRPGHERMILLRGRYANCRFYRVSGSLTVTALPVRERFLLWRRTLEFPLSSPLVIQFHDSNNCR